VMPQTYSFDRNLRLNKVADGGIHDAANKTDTKIIPLVFQDGFDRTLMSVILNIKPIQKLLISQLIAEAKKEDLTGWQYDFENIAPGDKDLYTDFVKLSAESFDQANLEFSVAIVPRQSDFNPATDDHNWSVAYDLKKIAEYADYVTLMTYDDPLSVGPAGSKPFAERTIKYALGQAPAEKLSLGIPLYCWKWYVNDGYRRRGSISQKLTVEDVDEAVFGIDGYNNTLESEWYLYLVNSGNIYMTWCDGVKGFEAKLDLIDKYNLRGFSAWALGQETQDIWEELE
jgi:spore germination protein